MDNCSTEGLYELLEIAKTIIEEKTWPAQCLVSLTTLSPNPGPPGGMRPIALLTMLHRMVTNILRPQVGQWDVLYAEEWDWAVAGRGAEAAAFQETMESELLYLEWRLRGRRACRPLQIL